MLLEKLEKLEKKYQELKEKLYDPKIASNVDELVKINKQLAELENIHNLYVKYKETIDQINEAKQILEEESDEEMLQLAKQQLKEAEERKEELEQKIKIALLPKDPNDDKNIYLEIRPAAWGEEAALFAAELLRMYLRYAEKQWRKAEIEEHQPSDLGGVKLAVVRISWDKVYSKLKFESWVHRVQRIPVTESWWRIHTSTVTVAVIPEVDDIDIKINPEDIEIDTYAASSAGWQHANKNETWVRIHHKPTGIIVNVWDSRSQLQNKEKAFRILKAKLYQLEQEKRERELKEQRLNQIWTWDRSEKIRTYNFPQDRVTDHRIKKSRSNLPAILDGEIDEIINDLIVENQTRMLQAMENNNS